MFYPPFFFCQPKNISGTNGPRSAILCSPVSHSNHGLSYIKLPLLQTFFHFPWQFDRDSGLLQYYSNRVSDSISRK